MLRLINNLYQNSDNVNPSTRGRYITGALLELALRYSEDLEMLKDVAIWQDIPVSYLESLMGALRASGMGGYHTWYAWRLLSGQAYV